MRIITINTWKGDGDYPRRLALLANGLQALASDILCLQESLQVCQNGPDTARHLADRLQLNLAWAPSRLKKRHVKGRPRTCFSGLAILSRHPIRQHRCLALPAHPKDPERIAQWIDIAVDQHIWRVVNLHLTHIRAAAALRQKQLTETLDQAVRWGSPDTVWLCGDFNAAPGDPEMQCLLNRPGWIVADAYTEAGGKLPGATFPLTIGRTGGRRIDRIFALTRENARRLRFQKAATVLMRPDSNGLYPSDHAGVMVDVDVESVPATRKCVLVDAGRPEDKNRLHGKLTHR